MKLLLSNISRHFLDTLPPKQFRQVVTTVFRLLTEPYPHDSKQLKGYSYYRVDIKEYRIVYDVNDDEVYRQLKRILL